MFCLPGWARRGGWVSWSPLMISVVWSWGNAQAGRSLVAICNSWRQSLALIPTVRSQSRATQSLEKVSPLTFSSVKHNKTSMSRAPPLGLKSKTLGFSLGSSPTVGGEKGFLLTHGFRITYVIDHPFSANPLTLTFSPGRRTSLW